MKELDILKALTEAHEKIGGIRPELDLLRTIRDRYTRLGNLVDAYFDERGPRPMKDISEFFEKYRTIHNGFDLNPEADIVKKNRAILEEQVKASEERLRKAQGEALTAAQASSTGVQTQMSLLPENSPPPQDTPSQFP